MEVAVVITVYISTHSNDILCIFVGNEISMRRSTCNDSVQFQVVSAAVVLATHRSGKKYSVTV